ncbi:MAG: hypothetical protein E6Q44_11500 [Flavobacteriales bacterium]|nr:MAG: hypothetical protein E6Q44_11500 [Flavobacteriales bacterium]
MFKGLQRNDTPLRHRPIPGRGHQQRAVEASPRDQSWPGTLMALGIFVSLISFWAVGGRTLIRYAELFRWFALFAFVGNLLPYARSGLRLGMERLEWFLFNLLAVGPLVLSLLLWLNLIFHGPERFVITPYAGGIMELRTYWMEQEELPASQALGTPLEALLAAPPPGLVGGHVIGTAQGVLGYEVITTYQRLGASVE